MPAWLIGPLASRLLMAAVFALAGALGIGWWSFSAKISSLTEERDDALVRVGRLEGDNDKLVLAVETQNGFIAQLRIQADRALAQSAAALGLAQAAGALLDGDIAKLRARVLPAAPDASCTAADALILEYIR
jgi:hypothetical protein